MDKQAFLASGLLEQFVLGITDPEETQEVERYLRAFPELNDEVDLLRSSVQQYALLHNIPPAPHLLEREIHTADQAAQAPAYGKLSWLNFLVIGSLVGLCLWSVWQIRSLQQNNRQLEAELSSCSTREQIVAFLKDPQTQPVVLTHTRAGAEAAALIYWNKDEKKAMLNPFNLPKLSANEQYQIWVDIAGKMHSIGLVDPSLEKYQPLKFYEKAQSLNITIEPMGGSIAPTVSKLVANQVI